MKRRIRLLIGLIAAIALVAGLLATPGISGVHIAWAGGTTTITASGTGRQIGNAGGASYRMAQSFQVYDGIVSEITFTLLADVGTPTGSITWELRDDASTHPNALLETGTIASPIASATNTITVSAGPHLAASTTYWLELISTTTQSSNNYWQWQGATTSTYSLGELKYSFNGGSSWTSLSGDDAQMSITTLDPTATPTLTLTPSDTPTNTLTPTPTDTPTITLTPSETPTGTLTPSETPTITLTPSDTLTPTDTFTPTVTETPTNTPLPTNTPVPTWTFTPSPIFHVVTTLTTGQEVAVIYTMTAGEIMNGTLELLNLCFVVFIAFLLLLKNRAD